MQLKVSWALTTCIAIGLLHGAARAGRFESFTEKAAHGPALKVVGATQFGGEGIEEFVGAGILPDGTIVAFGNAWGPRFPNHPPPLVLGRGVYRKLDPYLSETSPGKPKPSTPRADDPDTAGMLVFYRSRLEAVKKVVRFDWGVASVSAGIVARDGSAIYIAGRCGPAFQTAARSVWRSEPVVEGQGGAGPYDYGGIHCDGDVFIAKLPASGDGVLWAVVFPGARAPADRIWIDYEGNLYADIHGLLRVTPDGRSVVRIETLSDSADVRLRRRTLTATRSAHYLGIDPADGSFYYGGSRAIGAGSQSWRQPYLYRFNPEGTRAWKMWDWPAAQCTGAAEGNGLCADSSPRAMDVAVDGTLAIAAWSDGPNSVLTRQPVDLDSRAPLAGLGMDLVGMKTPSSVAYILKVDPRSRRVTHAALFQAYVPMTARPARRRGTPEATTVREIGIAPDGAVAFVGTAPTGLIQTPNALYAYPPDGRGPDGEFVAVLSGDLKTLLFSSYLPGCDGATLATSGNQFVVAGRGRPAAHDPPSTPTAGTGTTPPRSGADYAGYILLLAEP